jgi:hypothetical protein
VTRCPGHVIGVFGRGVAFLGRHGSGGGVAFAVAVVRCGEGC